LSAKLVHKGTSECFAEKFKRHIPAIADQSVITWGLKKTLGDVLEYKGEGGETVRLKLVAGLDNSIFQGNVLIDERALLEHFPSVSGSRVFLVEGSPLSIFLLLGGLGSFGLGILVYRNTMQRRGELAIMRALGFERRRLHRTLFLEHAILLAVGVLSGTAAALIAVLPHLLAPGPSVPFGLIALILLVLVLNGSLWIYLSAILATRGNLMGALRDE
jgi:putative ABC transport system permease protein